MTTLREDVAALARRTAEEFNKIREEIGDIEGGTGGGEGPSGPCTAENTVYENYGYHNVSEALDSLLYTPISISSFNNDVGTKEKGYKVTEVTLTWGINKTPTALTLNNNSIDPTLKSTKLTGLNQTTNATWTLKATDEKGSSSTKSTSISFQNGVYYGTGSVGASDITNAFILGLTKKLQTSRAITFTASPIKGQYIYYAFPSSMGTPTFYVGGFEGGFDLLTNLSFTNSLGHTESYSVYRSTNSGLGSTEVQVK
jgi:hypothetical protein